MRPTSPPATPDPVPEPSLEIQFDPVAEADQPWADGELARVERGRIQIRDAIHFAQGTADILPESEPTLEAVAQLLVRYWQIDHLLVVGHASTEGSHPFNFDLSARRARAIYAALISRGVHPDRVSYRGMGEVQPTGEAVESDRRAEFRILRQLHPLDPQPTYPTSYLLPWSGETQATAPSGDGLLEAR